MDAYHVYLHIDIVFCVSKGVLNSASCCRFSYSYNFLCIFGITELQLTLYILRYLDHFAYNRVCIMVIYPVYLQISRFF